MKIWERKWGKHLEKAFSFLRRRRKWRRKKRKFLGDGKCHDDRHTHSNFEEGTRIVDSELAIIIIFPKTLKSWASVYRQVWECWSGKHINVGIGDKADLWTYGLVITNTLWIEYMVFSQRKKINCWHWKRIVIAKSDYFTSEIMVMCIMKAEFCLSINMGYAQ